MRQFPFDVEKATEVLLYISSRCPDMYTALKILYFADKYHLARYGRSICGGSYAALKHGPVPSEAYDMIQFVRGDGWYCFDSRVSDALALEGNTIVGRRPADLTYLSESDREALDQAIGQYGPMSFGHLKAVSHADMAFQAVNENDRIPIESIVQSLGDRELAEYLDHQ